MADYTQVKDSGARQEFDTGSVRDTENGKGRYDLLSFVALDRLAKHYQNGAKKYGDSNWMRGQPLSRYLSSALRHLAKYKLGYREEDHLAAAMWNVAAMIWTEEMIQRGKFSEEFLLKPELGELIDD